MAIIPMTNIIQNLISPTPKVWKFMKLPWYTPTYQGLSHGTKKYPNFPNFLSLIFNDELFKIQ